MDWYYIEGILILSGINLLAVLGLSLLTGFTGLFSFGHAGFMAIGAYATAFCTMTLGLNFYLALIIGGLTAGVASLIIGKLTLNLKGDYFIIATLGFGEAIRLILDNVQYFGGARGWPGIANHTTMMNVIVINIIGVVVLINIVNSKHGRSMKAIREEEMASNIIGIDVFKYKLKSLWISAVYAGISGGLLAHYIGFLQPKMFQMVKSTELTIIVIFGGLGSVTGSVIGAVALTALPELLRNVKEWRLVFYGATVVLIMITRPQGLMGGKEFRPISMVRKLLGKKQPETGGINESART